MRRFEMIMVSRKCTTSSQRLVMSICPEYRHTKQPVEAVRFSKERSALSEKQGVLFISSAPYHTPSQTLFNPMERHARMEAMATLSDATTHESQPTAASAQPLPGGIWAAVRRRVAEPPATNVRVFTILRERGVRPSGEQRLWTILRERTNTQLYRPHAIPDVAADPVVEGGQTHYIVHTPQGTYIRLTEAQHEVWRAMDGHAHHC